MSIVIAPLTLANLIKQHKELYSISNIFFSINEYNIDTDISEAIINGITYRKSWETYNTSLSEIQDLLQGYQSSFDDMFIQDFFNHIKTNKDNILISIKLVRKQKIFNNIDIMENYKIIYATHHLTNNQ